MRFLYREVCKHYRLKSERKCKIPQPNFGDSVASNNMAQGPTLRRVYIGRMMHPNLAQTRQPTKARDSF